MTTSKNFQKRFISRQSRTNQSIENEFVIQFIKKREQKKIDENVADSDVVEKLKNEFDYDENRSEIQINSNDAREQFKQFDDDDENRSTNRNFSVDQNDFYVSRKNIIVVFDEMISIFADVNSSDDQIMIFDDQMYDKKSFDFDDKKKNHVKMKN